MFKRMKRMAASGAAFSIAFGLPGGGAALAQCTTHGAQQSQLLASNQGQDDVFGYSVAIEGDLAIVGAYGEDYGNTNTGAAYLFQRNGTAWQQIALLRGSSSGGAYDYFGNSVALAGDVIMVGSYGDTVGNVGNAGSAYAFILCNSVWTQLLPRLSAPSPGTDDYFGNKVAVDGDWAIVGASLDNHSGGTDAGSVFVYLRDRMDTSDPCDDSFVLHQQLTASDAGGGDEFGNSIDIQGDRIVIGAHLWDSSTANVGAAYVFERFDNGTPSDLTDDDWREVSLFFDSVASNGDNFGCRVTVDGDRVAVGANQVDHSGVIDAGSVYTYIWDNAWQIWTFDSQLVLPSPVANSWFGCDIDLDGDRLVAAAYGDDVLGNESGAVYIWEHCGGAWQSTLRLMGHETEAGDRLGLAVSIDGDSVLSGAYSHDELYSDQGAAYVHILTTADITSYCFGDGLGTLCPCTNDSPAGLGRGCLNSTSKGAILGAWGSDSISADDLQMSATGLIPNNAALLFAGRNAVNGGVGNPFGDGLRCAGGQVIRIAVGVPNTAGVKTWGPGISALGDWGSGDVRRFQVWYRDPVGPCSSTFNTTNGLEVVFSP